MKIESQKIFRLLESLENKHQETLDMYKNLNCETRYQEGYVDAIKEVLEQINMIVDDTRSNS